LPGVCSPSVTGGQTAVFVLQKQENGGGHIKEAVFQKIFVIS
jgi:hypothetical protein